MNGRPSDPSDHGFVPPDPTVTFALRAMAPPEHGDGFWDRLDASLRAESVAPTTAVPLVAPSPPPVPPPPPPPMAEVVPLVPRRSRPPALWIAAAAAVVMVAVAGLTLVKTTGTDVETTPAAPIVTVEAPTTAPPPTLTVPTTAGSIVAPPTSARASGPTSTVRRTTTTTRAAVLTLSPQGLGPLRLGMTTQQAEATGAVGPFLDDLGTGGRCGDARPAGTYRAEDFSALYLERRLARFYVGEGSRLRTPQGVGVGSPVSKLSTVPGSRNEVPHPYGVGTNVEITTGGVGYLFTVANGVVSEWSVGTTEGLALSEGCA